MSLTGKAVLGEETAAAIAVCLGVDRRGPEIRGSVLSKINFFGLNSLKMTTFERPGVAPLHGNNFKSLCGFLRVSREPPDF